MPLLVVLAAVAPAPPAQAHPFGPPQTIAIEADDGTDEATVRVVWRVGGTDDLTLLGVSLGVLPSDRVLLDGAAFYDDADAAALAAAPAFRDYLLAHVGVTAGGEPCPGEATVTDAFATDGVELSYRCAGSPTTVAVDVSMLTDLHPAYQTLATGPDGQRAVYDADQATHDWTLTGEATGGATTGTGTSAALQLGAVLAVLLGLAGGVIAYRRRGGRP